MSPARRATLDALVRRVLDGATDLAPRVDAAALVAARIDRMPPWIAGDVGRALALVGSRAAALATVGAARPFAALDAARQDRFVERWLASRVPLQRTAMHALRRLVLSVWYAHPDVQAALGVPGPPHTRPRVVPWEGPLDLAPEAPAPDSGIPDSGTRDAVSPDPDAFPIALVAAEAPRPRLLPTTRQANAPGGRIVVGASGDVHRRADVVVVGSGAGGAVVAARLAEAGREVVVVESGGLWTPEAMTGREGEMTERLYADQGLRTTVDGGVLVMQGDTVGGSTTVNWLAMLRPPGHVRDEWADRFGFDLAVSSAFDDALDRVWADVHARPMPEAGHSANNRLLLDGARALGWPVRALDLNARGCVRAGTCGYGCRADARQGTLATYLPRALAAGAAVYADAVAERIVPARAGAPARVVARLHTRDAADPHRRSPSGTLTVEAERVVVAAGAVGTPALLLRSGLGGGAVGRYLRLHPTTAVTGLYDRPILAGTGAPMTTICDAFAATGAHGYGTWLETPPTTPPLAAAALGGHGRAHAALLRHMPRMGALVVLVRDGADRDASNGSVTVDRAGRPRLRYRLGPTDARHLADGLAAGLRVHLAAGAREARTLHTAPFVARHPRDVDAVRGRSTAPNDLTLFSAHVNGTCRLGRDRRTSGARSDAGHLGERHGVPSVVVADGSLLPTGLGVNPQATILALAHLVADGLLAR